MGSIAGIVLHFLNSCTCQTFFSTGQQLQPVEVTKQILRVKVFLRVKMRF